MEGDKGVDKQKSHRARQSGVKAEKKKLKKKPKEKEENLTARQRNPKAFAINSAIRAERNFRRKEDLTAKKQHIPLVDQTPEEPPPVLIAVVGPPKVGKSTLINNLIKNFTRTNVTEINGPITIVTSKKRRITLIECNNDINSMIDIAKCADLVLLLCDASYGFEMEIFEFLNICQVHGMPKIMGVLTHLDMIKNPKLLRKRKKELKHRFWTEVYDGAKLFYLSGLIHGEYLRNEITNLGRFISVMKFRPLSWRGAHSYLLVDRVEDVTNTELIRQNPKCDRDVILYGYVRGVPMKQEFMVHIAGLGDARLNELSSIADPCPLPGTEKKRSLLEKERLLYAPMSGVGGIVYDKDAVYIELQGSHSHHKDKGPDAVEQEDLVGKIVEKKQTMDFQIEEQEFRLFSDGSAIKSKDFKEDIVEEADEEANDDDDESGDSGVDDSNDESDDEGNLGWKAESEDEQENNDGDSSDEEYQDVKDREVGSDDDEDDDEEEEEEQEFRLFSDGSAIKSKDFKEDIVEEADEEANDDDDESGDSGVDDSNDESDDEGNLGWKAESEDEQENNDGDSSDEEYQDVKDREVGSDDDEDDDEEEEEDEDDVVASSMSWKNNLAQKAREAYLERQSEGKSLMKLVYGIYNNSEKKKQGENNDESDEESDDEIGGLFKVAAKKQSELQREKDIKDQDESCLFQQYSGKTINWIEESNKELIKNCFVTGQWKASEDAENLLRLDDMDDDGELYGDYEDLETGQKHSGKKDETTEPAADNEESEASKKRKMTRVEEENLTKTELMAKKMKLKAKFDSEYDNKGEEETRITGDHSYYEELKAKAQQQSELNKSEFANLDSDLRVQIEGYRPGMYVRLGFKNLPAEFIENFDPKYPVLVGGLNMTEENIGFVNCKVKKHRWYKKILKTADPLILSMGWRRFQTVPIYAKVEDNFRHRYLKYTPNHVTCGMTFWGPITPQNTGFLALQSVSHDQEEMRRIGFRIAATGCVTELDKSAQIMKKLKLVGHPFKIYKKTAFIKGMFNSTLEVAKFEGAKIKTVSGIRGQIKKSHHTPEGSFRATFEDRILLSDIVFCRTWFRVDVPRFYAPVTSLLLPQEQKLHWQGMKTLGQLKRENNIKNEATTDSLYTEIKRVPKVFKPLIIPKALQRALPYKDKPKYASVNPKNSIEKDRVAVILSPHEQKVAKMMKMIETNYKDKKKREKQETKQRVKNFKIKKREEEAKKLKRQKELRKKVSRALSKMKGKSKD